MTVKRSMVDFLKKTPAYPVYRAVMDRIQSAQQARKCRKWTPDDERRMAFYAQFVHAGDIVFDVGANLGNRTKVFLRLGATVVAVEPQRHCADLLALAFGKNSSFRLERKALGAAPGEADMLVSRVHTLSTLSKDWVRTVQASGRFGNVGWETTERVPIDTLDRLIARHGRPAFVKIDVEGFEYEVLSGLSSPVRALSLEFAREYLDHTFQCVDHLAKFPGARFRISLGESFEFSHSDWVSAGEIREQLETVEPQGFGDLYAMCGE